MAILHGAEGLYEALGDFVMTDILGYDVNGEPLRAGDRVKILQDRSGLWPELVGRVTTVVCKHRLHMDRVVVDLPDVPKCCDPRADPERDLIRLKDDSPGKEHYKDQHKPCGQSFDELVKGFGMVEA